MTAKCIKTASSLILFGHQRLMGQLTKQLLDRMKRDLQDLQDDSQMH